MICDKNSSLPEEFLQLIQENELAGLSVIVSVTLIEIGEKWEFGKHFLIGS